MAAAGIVTGLRRGCAKTNPCDIGFKRTGKGKPMKARIEKKLSKRLLALAPTAFKDSWVDTEVFELAWEQGTSVSHIPMTGGEPDYYGEATDAYTLWEFWSSQWCWLLALPSLPEDSEYPGYPDLTGYKQTTRNLLRWAAEYEQQVQAERSRWEKARWRYGSDE